MTVNSKSRTKKIIAVTWILPFIVAGPYVFSKSYAFAIHSELGSISREICNDRFNDIDIAIHGDIARVGEFRKGYFLALFCVIYVIPSAIILITCIKIAVSLLKPILPESAAIARTESCRRQEENKRKASTFNYICAALL
ncbi:hypothetical protein DPMN_098753 [Dreissena polymorpha]|uniref:G-protein coupled receptors family 1 profile domain-containing protein n=1 Tax=Dreissena polymorpha TaxID=45954 RepID=A0A9D4R7K4_DREPO|nr:hypothetical protein DPMN_098753 [Dreissena polymorpha]